jgi:hypothetical protein
VLAVDAHHEMAGVGLHRRHLDAFGTVEIEFGEDRVVTLFGKFADHRAGGDEGAADIVGRHQAFCAQGITVAHQEVHRLLHRGTFAAVQHLLFLVSEFHGQAFASAKGRMLRAIS